MTAPVPSPQNYSNLVDAAVAQVFLQDVADNTIRVQPILERLQQNGSVRPDGSGAFVNLPCRVGEFKGGYSGDLAQRTFQRAQQVVNYGLPYSILEVLGALSEADLMFMSTPQAFYKGGERILGDMSADFHKLMNRKVLTENGGSSTAFGSVTPVTVPGNSPFCGVPSLMGTGTTQNYVSADGATGTTSGAIGAADKEALPNTSYFGVNTNPITPLPGVDNKVAESTSPVITNWSSTGWNGSAGTWLTVGDKVISHNIARQTRGNAPDQRPDLVILQRTNWIDFRSCLRGKASQQVLLEDNTPRSPDLGLMPRIFFNYEGATVLFDADQILNVASILNTKQAQYNYFPQALAAGGQNGPLKGKTDPLFSFRQDFDINQGAYKAVGKHVAQLWLNPYFQGASYNFA